SASPSAAAQGGVLNVGISAVENSIDPGLRNANPNYIFMRQVADSLTTVDQNGGGKPMLAESWKDGDPTTWEFTIKKGVKFHNGKERQAADAKFSIMRATDPKNQVPILLQTLANVADVTAVDNYTIRVKTKAPDATVPSVMVNVLMMPDGLPL